MRDLLKYVGRTVVIVLVLNATACSTWHMSQDGWTGQDKAKHFAVSAVLGAGMTHLATEHTNASHPAAVGIGVSLAIGGGKEVHDAQEGGSGFSWKDMAYNVGGALFGAGMYQMVK